MPVDEKTRVNGDAPFPGELVDIDAQLHALRLEHSRLASVVGALGEVVGALRTGVRGLKAENAGLRAELARLAQRRLVPDEAVRGNEKERGSEDVVALGVDAPAAARAIVMASLRGRVSAGVLEHARLVMSELVTNSVLHSGAGAEAVLIVRVKLTPAAVGIEVEDSGRDGAIAPRAGDTVNGGGFGLELVQRLSESWGLERAAAGGTRVWARLALATPEGDAALADRED